MLRIVVLVSVLVSVLANSGGSGMMTKPAEPCAAEIATVAEYHTQKATFDLIVDVRTYSEYVGDGDASCNAGKANKCNMGHDPHMWMLTNADRSDKAVLYKVNGTHTVDPKIVSDLKACYGAKVSTMKILVSCHSGGRSYELQQALVGAGFKCENIYNFKPGADGLFKANATLIRNNTMKGAWTCAAASKVAPCTTEITTVADYYAKKSTFDLIVDVRTFNEYVGNGDASCNAGKADKCNMGHDPDMWMLTNSARSDKAVLYKVDGVHTVDSSIVNSLAACYGAQASTMKVLVSCHSGARSYAAQQALVRAGFACGNIYNFKPGADGLFKADPAKLIKNNTMKGPWTCSAAKASTASSTGSSVAAASTLSLSAFSIATAYLGMVNVFF